MNWKCPSIFFLNLTGANCIATLQCKHRRDDDDDDDDDEDEGTAIVVIF